MSLGLELNTTYDRKGCLVNPTSEPAQILHNLHHSSAIYYPQSAQTGIQLRHLTGDRWWARKDSNLGPTDYCAVIQVFDPVSLTDTSEKKIRAGLPSAVPRWSVEIRRGPAFL
jgi:hypothetical protein